MLDLILRPVKERVFAPAARAIGQRLSPMALTLVAFVAGISAAVLVALGAYRPALALWLLNRLLDGLDGSLARAQGSQTDFGGYVDILLDFVVYAAIPIAFVIASPRLPLAVAALVLLGSFYLNAASWMYLAALLERRDLGARSRGELTSITMPAGVVGGTETILFYTVFFLLPDRLVVLFGVMSALVLASVGQRIFWAARQL
ncbi:MAG: CDP-alcohol phosphatidyltransferase family protein [Gemmatimonadota bacterium]|nr:CDP-alcohol phosphatidyltransferase family protein [Gemmatimonadota bacterium]